MAIEKAGGVEVDVRGNVDQFEKALGSAEEMANRFHQRSTKLFGSVAQASKEASRDTEMAARSMRLFTSQVDEMARAVIRATAERHRLGQAFQSKLNLSFGIGEARDVQARAADIQAYGAALDNLKAEFVPLFAAQQKYQQEIADINAAHRVGAISADEQAAAILRSKVAYDQATASIAAHEAATRRSSTSFRDDLDSRMGIGADNDNAKRAADIAAYGKELDNLRAKYVPLFALEQQYKITVDKITNAHRVGAISADEQTAALMRTKVAYDQAAAAAARGVNHFKMNSLQVGNLAAQFNDIAVTMAMGMNPWMIALQQGTQITQVTSSMKGVEALKMLAAGFTSLLNPISLATIATIGFGGMAVQWLSSIGGEVKTLDDILKTHEKNIKRLGPAYDDALKEAKKYATESAGVVNELLAMDVDAAAEKLKDDIFAAMQQAKAATNSSFFGDLFIGLNRTATSDFVQQMVSQMTGLTREFEPFRDIIRRLEEGTINVKQFREEVLRLGNTDEALRRPAKELLAFTAAAYDTEAAITGMTKQVDEAALAFGNLELSIAKIGNEEVRKRMTELMEQAKSGKIDINDLKAAILSLSGAVPNLSGAIAEFGSLAEAAIRARNAIGQVSLAQGLAGEFSDKAGVKGERISGPTADEMKQRMDTAQKFYDQQFEIFKKTGEIEKLFGIKHDKLPKQKVDRDANAYRDLIKNANDRIDQLKQEISLVGLAGTEVEALRFEQKLLADAMDKGRSVSAAQREEIRLLADEYGNLQQTLARTKLMADTLFERDQMFRNPVEQQVASSLRSAGLPIDFNSAEANAIRFNLRLMTVRDTVLDIASSFKDDLVAGVDVFEALANAAGRLGDKLLDMALNEGINLLFQSLLGGLGGGLGKFPAAPTGGLWAKGGVFNSGNVVPFARGGVVTRPTLFPMAKGAGLMGEAGPEAIMPLKRDSSGRLGIFGGSGDTIYLEFSPTFHANGADAAGLAELKAEVAGLRHEFPALFVDAYKKTKDSRNKVMRR